MMVLYRWFVIKKVHYDLLITQNNNKNLLKILNKSFSTYSYNNNFNFNKSYYITTIKKEKMSTASASIATTTKTMDTNTNETTKTIIVDNVENFKSQKSIKLNDYDYIGFDLDNTLVSYNIYEMVKLEYEILAKYLVEKKGYSKKYLQKSFDSDIDFLQKGLILDFSNGNILKVTKNGEIIRGTHGTRKLSDKEILNTYGITKTWNLLKDEYCNNYLSTWNGPLSEKMRSLLDYFDMPSSLIFARIVDSFEDPHETVQIENSSDKFSSIWPDILNGLIDMYTKENFENSTSLYFNEMKENPQKYIEKSSKKLVDFLIKLKSIKTTFVVTGSHIDFANHTATNALGNNWKNLFDSIICFAKKPGFFINNRPFMKLNGIQEIPFDNENDKLKLNAIYTQGNWNDLINVLNLKQETKPKNNPPKILYIGDNLIQDCYTPANYLNCDTIAISAEMFLSFSNDEHQLIINENISSTHKLLYSKQWKSYFGNKEQPTLWTHVIRKYSKLCVPSIDFIVNNSIDFNYKCFDNNANESNNDDDNNGFYPIIPKNLI